MSMDRKTSARRNRTRSRSRSRSRNRQHSSDRDTRSRSNSRSQSYSPVPDRDPEPETETPTPVTVPFKNDGSFLEMFKRLQQQADQTSSNSNREGRDGPGTARGRRRCKVLKTGLVRKKRPDETEEPPAETGDVWALYQREVNKYKIHSSEDEGSRLLTK